MNISNKKALRFFAFALALLSAFGLFSGRRVYAEKIYPDVDTAKLKALIDLVNESVYDLKHGYDSSSGVSFSTVAADVSSLMITEDAFQNYINSLGLGVPYFFNVVSFWSTYYTKNSVSYVNKIAFRYDDTNVSSVHAKFAVLNNYVDNVLLGIRDSWSELEKCLYVHDVVAADFIYDYAVEIYDIYNIIYYKKGVCEAGTHLTNYILDKAGVGVDNISSEDPDINHIWNAAKINGYWYNFDTTWDRTGVEVYNRISHEYFLSSDSFFEADGNHGSDFGSILGNVTCSNTKYNTNFIKKIVSRCVYYNGVWYFVYKNASNNVYFAKSSDMTSYENISTLENKWYVSGSTGTYYPGWYGGLFLYGNKVIYSTPTKVMAYNCDTNTTSTLYNYSGTKKIYGCYQDGAKCKIALDTTPYFSAPSSTISFNLPAVPSAPAGFSSGEFAENIPAGTLVKNLYASYGFTVYDESSLDRVYTGLEIWNGTNVYTISISGDFDRDGLISSDDVCYVIKNLSSKKSYPVVKEYDYDNDGVFGFGDATYLLKHIFTPAAYEI